MGRILRSKASSVLSEQWIEFEDDNGHGYAQPDHLIIEPSRVVIVECKLSQNDAAWDQLLLLYRPLIETIYPERESICVQSCKYLRHGRDKIVTDFSQLSHEVLWHVL